MRKKNLRSGAKKSENSAGSRWEIVYSGFVLILLCFFIMLSSFSTMQEGKVMQFVKSFVTAVSILPSGTKFEPGLAVVSDSADMVAAKSELAKIFQTLEQLAYEFNLEKEINLVLTREGLVMRMSEHMLFGLGSADIAAEALPLLHKVGAIISNASPSVVSVFMYCPRTPKGPDPLLYCCCQTARNWFPPAPQVTCGRISAMPV